MSTLILSFVAGVLTVLAPCVLPILPVILWGSVRDENTYRPWFIIWAFAVSVLIFTLGLQWMVQSLWLRQEWLSMWSAIILGIFGLVLLFPNLWQSIMHRLGVDHLTHSATSSSFHWYWWDILLWFLLWPIFNTCSPTFVILVATILPASFVWWLTNILVYILGLCLMLWLVVIWWRSVIKRFKRIADPNWRFKKIVALLLILVSLAILTKSDKAIETRMIEHGYTIDTFGREIKQAQSIK